MKPNEVENPLIKEWAHHTMESRKGHKIYNFWTSYELYDWFDGKKIKFHCSGDDNQPNGFIYMDSFTIQSNDLIPIVRDYQLSKLISDEC